MDVLEAARRTIRQLLPSGTRVLVALSGGSDSVALTHLMLALAEAGELHIAGLAHFNHQLRDAAADDERFCAGLSDALGLRLVCGRGDVAALARMQRISLENAGRIARHAFLEKARAELGADCIAVGHTRDDQAETFLLRVVRGAGTRGLSAMHPRTGRVVRPLLNCRRADLRRYLDDRAIAFVEDASNADVAIPRNRVRAELLPLLKARFNPRIVDALAAEAVLARDEHAFLAAASDQFRASHAKVDGEGARVDAGALAVAPRAVARLALHGLMTDISGGRAIGLADVERALELVAVPEGAFDAPGQSVQRIGPAVVLTHRPSAGRPASPSPANLFTYSLSIPGEVRVPEAGCLVSSEVRSSWREDFRRIPAEAAQAVVQLSAVQAGSPESLAVRSRRPGDRFRPLGLGGQKKLQDYFVDRKVVREARDRVPIVVNGAGRIVWVAGHGIDEAFRVTDPAQAVIILRLKGLGGSA